MGQRLIVLLSVFYFFVCSSAFAETWISFKRLKTPITNKAGAIVSADKRVFYARRVKDLTYGGEWINPPIEGKVLERYARHDGLLVKLDIDLIQAQCLINVFQDFKPQVLEDKTAETIKSTVFGIASAPIESGVTK